LAEDRESERKEHKTALNFCDYCLKQIPRHALLQWETGPKERQRIHVIERRVWPQVESVFR
jgi:hypothetical protein